MSVVGVAALHHPATRGVSSVFTVAASATSGLELAGAVVGILAGLSAIIGLALSIASNNAKRKKEYEKEIRDSFTDGKDSRDDEVGRLSRDLEYWRSYAMALLAKSGAVPPVMLTRPDPRQDPPTPAGTPDEVSFP